MMVDMEGLPQPSEAFDWVQAAGGPALVCRPLAALADHVFTSRAWGLGSWTPADDDEAWPEVARALRMEPGDLVRAKQVHGAAVLVAGGAAERSKALEPADIVVSNRADACLAVQVADCVPLLIADPRTGAVAAAHAGWRGLAAKVPSAAIAALRREFGSAPGDLVAAVGPSVGACCYEVGVDVRAAFAAAGFTPAQLGRWFSPVPRILPRNPPMKGLGEPRSDHWYFDGWTSTSDQLIEAGVAPDRVFLSELCTASHPGTFCSYRRDGKGGRVGRLAGAIRRGPRHP
jgi:YfiH family protein